jgi:hypothetical protein
VRLEPPSNDQPESNKHVLARWITGSDREVSALNENPHCERDHGNLERRNSSLLGSPDQGRG